MLVKLLLVSRFDVCCVVGVLVRLCVFRFVWVWLVIGFGLWWFCYCVGYFVVDYGWMGWYCLNYEVGLNCWFCVVWLWWVAVVWWLKLVYVVFLCFWFFLLLVWFFWYWYCRDWEIFCLMLKDSCVGWVLCCVGL